MSSTTTKSSANATASSTKKKNTKPPKSYTKNKKHQKHRGAGDKHFAMSGSSSSGVGGGGVGGGGSRGFRFTPSFILKQQNRDANAVDTVDTVDVNSVEKSAFGHRPIQSNEYRYQDADESDNDEEEENNELLMTKFGVKDERARYLQVLLDDLSGASSYHRKPWEKEWELDTDAANVNADMDDLFNLNTNQLANELKLLPVQQRLNLFAEQDDCVLSSIMKVHSSSIVGGGETEKKHDQSSDNGRFVTVSSVSLAHLCNEHQPPATVPLSSIDINNQSQQQQVEQQQEKEQELEEQDEDDDEYDLDDISEEELAESDDEDESDDDKQVEAATLTTVTKEAHQPPTVVQSQQKETPVSAQRTTAPNTISTGVTKQQDRVTVHRNDDADDDFFNQIDLSVNLTTVPPHHRSDIRNNNKQEQDDLDFIDNLLEDAKSTSVAAVHTNQGSRTAQVNTTKSPPTISAVPTKTSTATNITPKKSDDNLDDWLDSLI